MTELMSIKETMSSLQIAEITEKRHDAVLRDIRNLLAQGVGNHNFVETSYKSTQNKELPCFILTKKGCLILASGYNALLREKIINRWEQLEQQHRNGGFQVPQSYSEALMLAAKQAEELESAQRQIEQKNETITAQEQVIQQQAPDVEYCQTVLSSTSTYTTTQIAKEFGWGAETLNKKLKALGVQYKQNGQWLLYAKYQDKGYTSTITRTYTGSTGQVHTSQLTVWTEQGRRFIHSLFK